MQQTDQFFSDGAGSADNCDCNCHNSVKEFDAYLECLKRLNQEPTKQALIVGLGEKKLSMHENGNPDRVYPISASARPQSCQEGSLGTPWGLHEICEKYGESEPPGTVFVGRVSTHQTWWEREDVGTGQKCLVTTRILRLRGLEPGINSGERCDSHARYIYIHGTNHPQRFPENISSGCVLMDDKDLIQLYTLLPIGTHVWLSRPS